MEKVKKIWLSLAVGIVALVTMLVFAATASASVLCCDTLGTPTQTGRLIPLPEPAGIAIFNNAGITDCQVP